ncbi:MAG: hypothetical protein IPK73_31085 [Candidatus Obscuribacter sp.]|nr:hypothetical protein [Candidatus Obscuribacter sp.]
MLKHKDTFPPRGTIAPGHSPIQGISKAVRPKDARRLIENRKRQGNIFNPQSLKSGSVQSFALTGNPIPLPFADLAEALDNDVDKIFWYVRNNYDFLSTFGGQKGAYSCQIEKIGNSFDQSSLMVALLRAAGYTANFLYGELKITAQQAGDWLGSDPNNIWSSRNLLANGSIPVDVSWDATTFTYYLHLSHCWVKVDIGGTWYVFDPSFKAYTATAGIDIDAATGFDATTFQNAAFSGSTITSDYFKDINTTNLAAELGSMAGNLGTWIENNKPDATIDDIIGYRRIVPIDDVLRQTTLPHQNAAVTPVEWTDIPASYKASLRVQYDTLIDQTFYSEDIAGRRLTLFFNSNLELELRLDGVLIDTSPAQGVGTWNSVLLTVEHPYPWGWGDQSWYQQIWAGNNCLIAQTWGNTSPAMAEMHYALMEQNISAGGQQTDENVLGEALAYLWHTSDSQAGVVAQMTARMNVCTTVFHHQVGLVGHGESPFMDLGGVAWSTSANDNDYTRTRPTDLVISQRGIGFEANSIQQIPSAGGVSTDVVIAKANENGQKIYFADSANWATNVRPNLVNYTTQTLDDIEAWYINAGWQVMIHEDGATVKDQYHGYGFYAISPYGGTVGLINGMLMGGTGSVTQTPQENVDNAFVHTPKDQKLVRVLTGGTKSPEREVLVDKYTGKVNYAHVDFAYGSQPFPYSLPFERYYNNEDVSQASHLGYGWKHNYMITLRESNRGPAVMSIGTGASPAPANFGLTGATNIAQIYSTIKLIAGSGVGGTTIFSWAFVLGAFGLNDISKQLTQNIVIVEVGNRTYTFTKLWDGTFVAPAGERVGLSYNSTTNIYTMKTFSGLIYTFTIGGKISKIEYPYLVTTPSGIQHTVVINFTYGGVDNRLLTVSSTLGQTLTFNYVDLAGLVYWISSIAYNGNIVAQYDIELTTGKLNWFKDTANIYSNYEYDAQKKLLSVSTGTTSSGAAEYSLVYNSSNRVKTQMLQIGPGNSETTEIKHLDGGNGIIGPVSKAIAVSSTPSVGPATKTIFNDDGKPVAIYTGTDDVTTMKYDGQGRVIEQFTAGHGTIKTTYDAFNRVLSKELVGLGTETWTYSAMANESFDSWITYTDRMGRTYTRSIDLVTGHVMTETDPAGNTKSFTYNSNGLIASSTDQTGVVTTYGYSGVNLASVTVGGTITTSYTYDSFTGDRLTVTTPNNYTTTMQYDAKRRLTSVSDPLSATTFNTYDIWGNLLTTSKGAQLTQMTYSGTNNPLTVTDPLLNTSSNVWDLGGRLTQSTDAAGRLTEYFYDANGRLASIKKSGVTEEGRTYRPGGNLWTISDANGNMTTFNQDDWGRLTNMVYPDGSVEAWTYDAMGNVLTHTNRGGAVTTMAYDSRNRMVTKSPDGQPTVTFTYDNAGRLLTASTPVVSGDPSSGTFSKAYDGVGRLISETNPQGQVVSYQYDNASNVTRITYPGGYFVDREYDGLNRLTAIKLNGSATAAATFTYDVLGRRTTKVYNNGNSVSYGYDLGNNLLTRDMTVSSGTVNWTYTYNQVHQMLTQNVSDLSYLWTPPALGSETYGTANNRNQYPSVGGASYSYSNAGNLTGDGTWTFGYNTENMLTSAVAAGTSASFSYDPFVRQTQKTVGTTKTKYVYSGSQLLEEYDGTTNALLRRYVYAGPNEPIFQIDSSGTVTYLHHDHLGSVIAQANASGVVGNKYQYSPFGEATSMTGTTIGYTGQRWDNETGLYHYKARYYRPGINRFLQTDPIGYQEDLHLYAYVKNDPMNATDPEGLEPEVVIAWHSVGIPGTKTRLPVYHASLLVMDHGRIQRVYTGNGQGGNLVHDGGELILRQYNTPRSVQQYKENFVGFSHFQKVSPGPMQTNKQLVSNLAKEAARYRNAPAWHYGMLSDKPSVRNSNTLATSLLVNAGAKLPSSTPNAPGWGRIVPSTRQPAVKNDTVARNNKNPLVVT